MSTIDKTSRSRTPQQEAIKRLKTRPQVWKAYQDIKSIFDTLSDDERELFAEAYYEVEEEKRAALKRQIKTMLRKRAKNSTKKTR